MQRRFVPHALACCHAFAHTPARLLLLALVAGCGAPSPRANADSAASAAAASAATVSSDTSVERVASGASQGDLVGRLLSDVVADSALLSSWGVYPLERHIGIRLVDRSGTLLLLADTLVGYDGPHALWRIRQVQTVERTGPGEMWVGSCMITGADASDGTVVARVTLTPGDTLTPIHAAWRLDPVAWQFRRIRPDSLFCYNEGGG